MPTQFPNYCEEHGTWWADAEEPCRKCNGGAMAIIKRAGGKVDWRALAVAAVVVLALVFAAYDFAALLLAFLQGVLR